VAARRHLRTSEAEEFASHVKIKLIENDYAVLRAVLRRPQTIRIQQREDGISLDQIVLSPDTCLTSSLGATKNDTTILDKTS